MGAKIGPDRAEFVVIFDAGDIGGIILPIPLGMSAGSVGLSFVVPSD